MTKIIELVKYQLRIYFKASKFVVPIVATAIFLFVLYMPISLPIGVIESSLITCYWVFLLMVWVGLSVSSDESPIMEQILFLRVQSNVIYYFSKMLFFMVLGFIVNCICLLCPVLFNILSQGGVYGRALSIADVLNDFVLLCGASMVGSSLGSFFHSRVMKDRKLATVLTALLATITLAKTAIINGYPLFKIIAWILPPLDMVLNAYSNVTYFQLGTSVKLFFILFLYATLVFTAKSLICYRRKF